jgi:hypothetical protein
MYTSTWLRGTSYCTWPGLKCSGTAITGLQLVGVGVGTWPSSVSSLSYLQSFNYEPSRVGNVSTVSVQFPAGISSWTSLTSLRIVCTRVTTCLGGAIDAMASLPALQSLTLRGLGSVTAPSAWSLPALTSLALQDVVLAGTLPALSGLQSLYLNGAGFTALAALPASLQSIAISNTPLAGSFPDVSGLTALTSIAISGTSLSGTLPAASCAVLSPGYV